MPYMIQYVEKFIPGCCSFEVVGGIVGAFVVEGIVVVRAVMVGGIVVVEAVVVGGIVVVGAFVGGIVGVTAQFCSLQTNPVEQ